MLTGNQDLSRQINRLHILNAIRQGDRISRTELATQLGLAQGTVSAIVGDLVDEGMLFERTAKTGAALGGRPRLLLEINPNVARVVGAYISASNDISVDVANLRGDRLASSVEPFDPSREEAPDSFADAVAAAVRRAVAKGGLPLEAIHSVGVGVPGVAEPRAGVVHWLPGLLDRPVRLAEMIEARLGRPVVIDNTAHLAARAERWFGSGGDSDDFALVLVGRGIGIGQYVGGELWLGSHGLGPEIGHTKVGIVPDAPCACGGTGCLAAFASGLGILRRASGVRADGVHEYQTALDDCAKRAVAGDSGLSAIFEEAGRGLGLALANLINVADPARLIVVFETPALDAAMRGHLERAVTQNTLRFLTGRTALSFRLADTVNGAQGAAALVLERIYRMPLRRESALERYDR